MCKHHVTENDDIPLANSYRALRCLKITLESNESWFKWGSRENNG